MSSEERGREVWIEKYRPQSLDEIHGQERIVERLKEYVRDGDMSHMLFAGPAGVGKCVTGETPVLTDQGVAPIEEVVGDVEGFADPREGLEVLTFADDGGFEYAEPSHVFGKPAEKLVRVGTRDGNELTVTPEHKLLVLGHDGLEWKPAGAVEAGERVVRPLRTPLPEEDGTVPWVEAMDGDRTLVHVTEAFAREHDVPAEEEFVGKKKRVVAGLRRGEPEAEIAEAAGTTRKTVAKYRRQVADRDLSAPSTVCSLSYLRELDLPRSALEEAVTAVQYVNRNNRRSEPVAPPWELTPALGSLVGLAVSEARIDGGRIKFYNTDEELLKRFESAVEATFGQTPRQGEQKGVPYREIGNRTVTHLLESCFDVVDGATGGPGVGLALVTAGAPVRRAFLRAVFDAEAHVSKTGVLELTQRDGALVTLVAYLLAAEGVPSRRTTERKTATNSDGEPGKYHTLYVPGARAAARFEEAVGVRLEGKAERLRDAAARDPNPNDDTVPTQSAVDTLCDRLYLTKGEHVSDSLNPETPGRVAYLEGVDGLLDAASARIEQAQRALERVDSLEGELDAVAALPAVWAGERTALEPLDTRKPLAEETGVGTGRLLEYAQGRHTPTADRAASLLDGAGALDGTPPLATVREELRTAIEELGVPYNRVAEGTGMRGTDVINLLEEGHSLQSLPRFATVAERVREVATGMLSGEVLEALRTLHVLTSADLYFDEVESVEAVEERRRVYDLTVPDTHNYVAGAVPTVMHNTTSAVAIAKETYGDEWRENFLELNASDERGIDVVRDRIKSFARASFGGYDYRIVFLDEADALCVPPGTEVVTGYPSSPEVKPVEEVAEDGEPIPSVDFETNGIQSDKGRLVDSGVADFFELELTDGRTVTASLTHPFFVVGDDGELVEKELRAVPGDEIADFRDDVGVSRCETCGDWTAGRFCSVGCKNEGHSNEMQGDGNPMYGTEWSEERREEDEFEPALVSDGGLRTVQTAEIRRVEYSHRGKAYNISMEGTPNFMLANGILTHNTDDAQGALRRTMEQFSNNARFVLSCNYSSRIIDPIQSRCAVFRFSPLSDEAVAAQVREIAADQGIELTDDGLDALVYAAGGDMRAAINGLQAASVAGGPVDEEAVFAITSTARPEEIREMVELALDGDFTQARSRLDALLREEGIAGGDIVDQLHRSVWEFDLTDREAVQVMERVGEADYRITAGASEQIQLEALLASLATEE